MERVAGIEPARSAWEADRLPLHHTRAALRDHATAANDNRQAGAVFFRLVTGLERECVNAYFGWRNPIGENHVRHHALSRRFATSGLAEAARYFLPVEYSPAGLLIM